MSSILRMSIAGTDYIKPRLPVGCGFDVVLGEFVEGIHGESILVGGMPVLGGISGPGNVGKSTTAIFTIASALDKLLEGIKWGNPELYKQLPEMVNHYDPENNVSRSRLISLTKNFKNLKDEDMVNRLWVTSDGTVLNGSEWFKATHAFTEMKADPKNRKKLELPMPWLNNAKTGCATIPFPTFLLLDSMSDFRTEASKETMEDLLAGKGGDTLYLRLANYKYTMMSWFQDMAPASGTFMTFTAHIGDIKNMQSGPGPKVDKRPLKNYKADKEAKHIPRNWNTALLSIHDAQSDRNLFDKDGTEYPDPDTAVEVGNAIDQDLKEVTFKQLRGKTGMSGMSLTIVISQREGVLEGLTNFHRIKTNDRFGITGNNTHYVLDLCPDVKISRTTVRKKLKDIPKLARAAEITSDLLLMQMSMRCALPPEYLMITPQKLYDDIKALGYDWDMILEKTRGWHTVYNDAPNHELKFLSTLDLLKMRVGKYKPFWL